jgi:hypothetical protein
MSYIKTPEEIISMWIKNLRKQLESGNIKSALEFLDSVEGDWEKYQRGELYPMAIHTMEGMFDLCKV